MLEGGVDLVSLDVSPCLVDQGLGKLMEEGQDLQFTTTSGAGCSLMVVGCHPVIFPTATRAWKRFWEVHCLIYSSR